MTLKSFLQRLALTGALALAAGCGGTTTQTPPLSSGSTGAFGIVTVNGKQKLYLPLTDYNGAGDGHVAVVDVGQQGNGVAGAPARLADIDLGVAQYATATGGDSSVVIAVSTDFPTVWLIDPSTDKVTKTIALDASAGPSSFSGGGGYVTGVAVDSANHRAILSVWNGFALLDTQSGTITQTIQAPPSENFGFDSVHQRILAPFYECSASTDSSGTPPSFCGNYLDPTGAAMTDGLNVIDLADGTVYTYQDPSAGSTFGAPTVNEPVGGEPDSAAVDPNTQVAVVPSEEGAFENVIELAKASFDKSSKTVTAPNHFIQGVAATGSAIEPTKQLAFFEEEWSTQVGLLDLNAAVSGTGTVYLADMPNDPTSTMWSNLGDPHGIAVTTALSGGKSVGVVVNGTRTWVARIDLEKMGTLVDQSGQITDLSPAVTFFDATTNE